MLIMGPPQCGRAGAGGRRIGVLGGAGVLGLGGRIEKGARPPRGWAPPAACAARAGVVMPGFASPRPSVPPKRKRKAETLAFMAVAEAPFDLMCS